MKLEKEHISRCGIFLFFDKEGIVDDYILRMLGDMKKCMDHLLVVCNGFVTLKGLERLGTVSDEVLCRANIGLDVGGYRDGLFHIGFDRLSHFDELVLFNYTFFGPLDSFEEMFEEMSRRDVDFWGITKHHMMDETQNPIPGIRYGYMPDHLQSHFFALRPSLFMSYGYRDFMINRVNPRDYHESINEYEIIFTKYFEDLGYVWDLYSNTDVYRNYVFNPMMFRAKEMIRDLNCPIIKRRAFFTDYMDSLLNTCGETSIEALEYIRENRPFPEKLFWDNILRLENLREVHRQMHFNYILPKEECQVPDGVHPRFAVWIVVDSSEETLWYLDYLENFRDVNIFLTGEEEELEKVRKLADNNRIYFVPISGKNYYLNVLAKASRYWKQYPYMCVLGMHGRHTEMPVTFDRSAEYQAWENMVGSPAYIANILQVFEENPQLGLLIPPTPVHGEWPKLLEDGWMGRFDTVSSIMKEWEIPVNLKRSSEPLFPVEGCFWVRTKLLETYASLRPISILEREAFLLTVPLVIQKQFYYTGVAMTEEYAAVEITNQDYMLRETNRAAFDRYGAGQFHEVVGRIRIS